MTSKRVRPDDCRNMAEVRQGVDRLDEDIVTLLAERFGYMRAAARIKPSIDAVRDEDRKAQVIGNVTRLAADKGMPPDLVARMYEALVEGSIAYELERFKATRL